MIAKPIMASPLLLTRREAAQLLGVSERTLYSISSPRGTVPCVKVTDRTVRYSRAALMAWIEERSEKPAD